MIKGVKHIVVFQASEDGSLVKAAEYRKSKGKRKRSRALRQTERNVRKLNNAMRTLVDEIDSRHERSTRKKKDGWLRDAPKNTIRAQQKAFKKLRKITII